MEREQVGEIALRERGGRERQRERMRRETINIERER